MRTKRVFTPPKTLPVVPKLRAALAEPPTALPQEKPEDQQKQQDGQAKIESPDFIQNFGDWHAQYPTGNILHFIVFDYLTQTKQWQNHYEFEFMYRAFADIKADFFIHYDRLVWQVKGYIYGDRRDDALSMAQEAILRKQRFRVVKLYEDDLIYRTEYTLGQALEGQQALGREDAKGASQYVAN